MDALITDRTREDEAYAFENQHLPNLKGAYNASDLNRVGEWVNYLAGLLNSYGYHVSATARTDWTATSMPREADFMAYLNSIRSIRNWFLLSPLVPSVLLDIRYLNFSSANDIEKILLEADSIITNLRAAFVPLGTFQLGVGAI